MGDNKIKLGVPLWHGSGPMHGLDYIYLGSAVRGLAVYCLLGLSPIEYLVDTKAIKVINS